MLEAKRRLTFIRMTIGNLYQPKGYRDTLYSILNVTEALCYVNRIKTGPFFSFPFFFVKIIIVIRCIINKHVNVLTLYMNLQTQPVPSNFDQGF